MLGRPSFLILATFICILALWVFFYALFGVDDGIIRLDVTLVTTLALLTSVISLAFLLLGIICARDHEALEKRYVRHALIEHTKRLGRAGSCLPRRAVTTA